MIGRTILFILLISFVVALLFELFFWFFVPNLSYFRSRIAKKRYDFEQDSLKKRKELWKEPKKKKVKRKK